MEYINEYQCLIATIFFIDWLIIKIKKLSKK